MKLSTLGAVLLTNCLSSVFALGCSSTAGTDAPAPSSAVVGKPRRPVIIDTDMAQDDFMAILYLLHRPDIDVRAITVASTGEATCDLTTGIVPGAQNALGLLALAGKDDGSVTVACGRTTPLRGTHTFPLVWTENVNNRGGMTLPAPQNTKVSARLATDVLVDVLDAAKEPITLVALGPLTNVGELLERRPDLASKIESTWIMGGAVEVPGNLQAPGSTLTDNTTAEWNIYVDPYAAGVVIRSLETYLVPLDGTNDARVTLAFRKRLGEQAKTPTAKWLHQLLSTESNTGFIESGHFYFWDPLAAAAMTDASVCRFDVDRTTGAPKQFLVEVVVDESFESGRTKEAATGSRTHVCTGANSANFEDVFVRTLNGEAL